MSPGDSARGPRRQWWEAGRALALSGVLMPPSPAVGLTICRMVLRHGVTPATLFGIAAARYPGRTAIIDEAGEITYAELYRRASAIAADVGAAGARPSSVAVLCRNHRGFALAAAVAGMLGAEFVSLNTELTEDQLAALLGRHSPALLMHDGEYSEPLGQAGFAGRMIDVDEVGYSGSGTGDDADAARPTTAPPRVWAPGKITLLTSGTSGLAKGVPRSINPLAVARLAASGLARVPLRSKDSVLVGPPFFHAFGYAALLGAVGVGATVVCRRKFDAAEALEDMAANRVTVLFAVPAMLQRILEQPSVSRVAEEIDLRVAVTGAAPATGSVVSRFHDLFGPILRNGYGSTEAGLVSIAEPDDLIDDPATVGAPALGVRIRISDPAGATVQTRTRGRILTTGPWRYSGYTPDPDRPAPEERFVDGFVDTGDVGYVDERGRLFISGRSDDMIVSGGENIFPAEVEDALSGHPDLVDVTVVGVDDDTFGEVLHAFVVPASGASVSPEKLKDHLLSRIERYKVPKLFVAVDSIPRNEAGKVLRERLR